MSIRSLAPQHILQFFFFFLLLPRVFSLPLATLFIIVSSSLTIHLEIEIIKKKKKKKKSVSNGFFFPGKSWSIVSDVRRSCCPIGSRFQVGGEIIAWLFANPYELKSRIWVWEEYNHFEWIYGVCRCDRFLTMTNESVSVNFDICPVATIYTTRLAYF